MKEKDLNKQSQTDWARVDELTDENIDTSDIPPLDDSFFENAKLRLPKEKISVTVDIESDIWLWLNKKPEQIPNLVNKALREYAKTKDL